MDEIKDLIFKLSEKQEPVKYDIRFIRTKFDEPTIISGDVDWLVNDMVGSAYLNDIFDKETLKEIPYEFGIYSAELWVQSYRSNHPQDPEEWDMNMWLKNITLELKLSD